jgi:hypothetical protein
MAEVTGGCLCPSVRYTLKAALEEAMLCHCTHCQKGDRLGLFGLYAEFRRSRYATVMER